MNALQRLRKYGSVESYPHKGSPAFPNGGHAVILHMPESLMKFGEVSQTEEAAAKALLTWIETFWRLK